MSDTIEAAQLVLDFTLYPRHHLDAINVTQIVDAIEAGESLPAVIADRASKRVVDGFHRATAWQRVDSAAQIEVEWRDYASDAELFLDAVQLNARHGCKLTPWDQARVITVAEDMRLTPEAIALALAVPLTKLYKVKDSRQAFKVGGSPVMVKRSLRHLAGKQLTPEQERVNTHASGMPVSFHANQIVALIEADAVDWENPLTREAIERLTACLSSIAPTS